jgi:hypothetical protein
MKNSPKKSEAFCVDVEVTGLGHEQRMQVISDYSSKPGFIEFSTRWENQFTDKEKIFYAFQYRREAKKPLRSNNFSSDRSQGSAYAMTSKKKKQKMARPSFSEAKHS